MPLSQSEGGDTLRDRPSGGELDAASPEATVRAARLMDRDSDRPMDLADATLVALAEEHRLTLSSPSTRTSTSTGSADGGTSR
jgi:hypothetical protein